MNKEEAMQVFDGIMLGDAGVYRNGKYATVHIAKSGEKYLPYLTHLRDIVGLLGVEFCTGHPKCCKAISSTGKPFMHCQLESITSPFLLGQRQRWYPKGKKEIPYDVRITPLSLAYMFMDDGTASWQRTNLVKLNLATDGFSKEEAYRLRDLIAVNLRVHFSPYPATKMRLDVIRLWLLKIEEINLFFDLIESYMHPCYMYKVKRPKTLRQARLEKRVEGIVEEFNMLREAIVR